MGDRARRRQEIRLGVLSIHSAFDRVAQCVHARCGGDRWRQTKREIRIAQRDRGLRLRNNLAQLARGKHVAAPARRRVFEGEPAVSTFAGTYAIAPGFALAVAATPRGLTLAGPDGVAIPLDRTGPTTFFFRPLDAAIGFEDAAMVWGGARFPKASPAAP